MRAMQSACSTPEYRREYREPVPYQKTKCLKNTTQKPKTRRLTLSSPREPIYIYIFRGTQSPTLSTTPTHMVREAAVPALSLNGKLAAKVIRQKIKERIAGLAKEGDQSSDGTVCAGRAPGLGIVMANG